MKPSTPPTKQNESHPAPEPRISAKLMVRFGTESGKVLTDFSVNLTSGGMFLETECLMPPESPLSIEFELPKSRCRIRCQGRVALVNSLKRHPNPYLPAGMGVQFINLSLEDLSLLREYIKESRIISEWED